MTSIGAAKGDYVKHPLQDNILLNCFSEYQFIL